MTDNLYWLNRVQALVDFSVDVESALRRYRRQDTFMSLAAPLRAPIVTASHFSGDMGYRLWLWRHSGYIQAISTRGDVVLERSDYSWKGCFDFASWCGKWSENQPGMSAFGNRK